MPRTANHTTGLRLIFGRIIQNVPDADDTRACTASRTVVMDAIEKAHFRLQAVQYQTSPHQSKVLDRLLEAGHVASYGGFRGGMSREKYSGMADASKATAT